MELLDHFREDAPSRMVENLKVIEVEIEGFRMVVMMDKIENLFHNLYRRVNCDEVLIVIGYYFCMIKELVEI